MGFDLRRKALLTRHFFFSRLRIMSNEYHDYSFELHYAFGHFCDTMIPQLLFYSGLPREWQHAISLSFGQVQFTVFLITIIVWSGCSLLAVDCHT